MTFEEAHKELEAIVGRLEQGQASLDEMTELWRRGEELYAFCRGQLDAAQGRIEELAKGASQGDEVASGGGRGAGERERLGALDRLDDAAAEDDAAHPRL